MATEGQNTDQHTQDSDGAGDKGGTPKLIFGKYKTLEEAEKGHKELERKYHEGNERYVALDARLQAIESTRDDGGDEGYGRGSRVATVAAPEANQQNTQLLTQLYSDPVGTLRAVQEQAVVEAERRISQRQAKTSDYQARVGSWAGKNPDVAQYGDLLTFYVNQTDARLTPETRLDQAAEQVRKRVIELKGTQQQEANAGNFVDGATGSQQAQQGGAQQQQVVPGAGETALKVYAATRNRSSRKPLQHGAAVK